MKTTADLVLEKLATYGVKKVGSGREYRCNSPFRPDSNSNAFALTVEPDGEHGAYHDHARSGVTGSLYDLAEHLGVAPVPYQNGNGSHDGHTTKRSYSGLADYAGAHHTTAEVFELAGWHEVEHIGRAALAIPTKAGTRYRFLDNRAPAYINEKGYRRCWYGLDRAIKLAVETGQALVIANGEASVVVAQHSGLAACAVTSGEQAAIPDELLQELMEAWSGVILVAYDCDETGREKAPKLVAQLCQAGFEAHTVDLNGGIDGYDIADFVGRHRTNSPAALRELKEMGAREAPAIPAPPSIGNCPGLTTEAIAVYEHLDEDRIAWLTEYVRHGQKASPRTPRTFHEAAGLFAASTVIARRLHWGGTHTNLYILYLAPPALYAKTWGLELVSGLLRAAGLRHLLLPETLTPEALVEELSLAVPAAVMQTDEATRDRWLQERAFAAQRGWIIDEAFGLFDSLKRDYSRGLLPLLLELYNCKEEIVSQTRTRWRTIVNDTYLSILGASTPSSMAEHLANRRYWTDGLWSRFALIVPDEEPVYQDRSRKRLSYPPGLVLGLQSLASLFSTPTAELVDEEGADGTTRKAVQIIGREEAHEVHLGPGVWEASGIYDRLIGFEFIKAGNLEPELHACYNRLPGTAMKVAMILAALDADRLPVTIELCHYAHAQVIVERWREALHNLRNASAVTDGAQEIDKIMSLLTKAGEEGVASRDIYRATHLAPDAARERLDELARQGVAEAFFFKASNGKNAEMWRWTGV